MKIKALLLSLICLLGSSVTSCFFEHCDPVPAYFEVTGITSGNYRFTNEGINPWESVGEMGSVNWENFFLKLNFEVNYIAQSHSYIGGSVMALSCDEAGYAGDKIGVDTLYVKTKTNYNNEFSEGDTLNNIVLTNRWTYYTSDFNEFVPLSNYLQANKEGIADKSFEIKFSDPPSNSGNYSFEIIYILNDGNEFTHTTYPVTIKK